MNEPTSNVASLSESEFYDEMWRNYGHLDAVSPAAFHRRRIVVQLAARYAANAANILDVGCGQGELLRELTEAIPSAKVFGADLSAQSIADSRKRNPTFDLFQLDLTHPDFVTTYADRIGAFDLVVCSEVLEHIPNDALAASNVCKLLSPTGVAIVTVPGGKMSAFDKVIGHQRHYSPETLSSRLGEAGFRVEQVLAWGFPFHSFYRTAVRIASRWSVRPGEKKQTQKSGVVPNVLGAAYGAFGKALKPLFYLNMSIWGEQLMAVGRRT
jgi:SAM-dependent methyltransferase